VEKEGFKGLIFSDVKFLKYKSVLTCILGLVPYTIHSQIIIHSNGIEFPTLSALFVGIIYQIRLEVDETLVQDSS
jgi:hypothetical protein